MKNEAFMDALDVFWNTHERLPTTGPLAQRLNQLRRRRFKRNEGNDGIFAEMDKRFPCWEVVEDQNTKEMLPFVDFMLVLKRFMDKVHWKRFPCRASRSGNPSKKPNPYVDEYLGHRLENLREDKRYYPLGIRVKMMDWYFPLWDRPVDYRNLKVRPRSQFENDQVYQTCLNTFQDLMDGRPDLVPTIKYVVYCACKVRLPEFRLPPRKVPRRPPILSLEYIHKSIASPISSRPSRERKIPGYLQMYMLT